MASTVASLFGPSAEEIVYARKREDEQLAQQRYLTRLQQAGEGLGPFAWAARAGVDVGETLRTGGLFGDKVEDPLIKKYNRINAILAEEEIDLNDPDGLKRIAKRLEQEGFMNEAVNLYDRASGIATQQRQLDIQEMQYGPKLNKDYLNIEGKPVRTDTSGNFFDYDGTPIPADEVIRTDIYYDYMKGPQAIRKAEQARARRLGQEVPKDVVAVMGEDGNVKTVEVDTSGAQTALDAKKKEKEKADAAAEAELARTGQINLIERPKGAGAVISGSAALEGGLTPEELVEIERSRGIKVFGKATPDQLRGITGPEYVDPETANRIQAEQMDRERRQSLMPGQGMFGIDSENTYGIPFPSRRF